MARYDDEYPTNPNVRQKDLVLANNEYVYVQNRTNGQIKTYTGPIMITISQQESLVIFNPKTKRFEETSDFEQARQLFTSAPENWYIILKNPAVNGEHPEESKPSVNPAFNIGRKVMINGPASFSLFPGQMAKVVQGHRLRSNQYLMARVYDADAATKGIDTATIVNAEGQEVTKEEIKYHAGQLLVIKGTEVSFYIPPTGIEVIPVGGKGNNYIRDAVTLERLEYAILKDEDGNKRYCHGPAVVFPEPTETFVETPKGGNIFRALELSPISGIYVKVIAPYKDDKGVEHSTGEELFITGNDQMIYYPRSEHAIIQYDGKYMHHAIAIPEGEGRYILNRLTGEITTVTGPSMYLPDPRKEVVVKRKLSPKECELIYPNNAEVLAYNLGLTEKSVERGAKALNVLDTAYCTTDSLSSLALFEANANISRGTSYTKPRTITLDTKFEGVPNVDVWTGYAINIVSKSGKREIIVGPVSRLLDYDETLEAIHLSTGKPKNTDNLLSTAFLKVENNKVTDIIEVQTKDFVNIDIKLSYDVNFLDEYRDKWFSVENYVKHLCDKCKSTIKQAVKKYTIEEFYNDSTEIIRNTILTDEIRLFEENGMYITDIEVLKVTIQSDIAAILKQHQTDIIETTLSLSKERAKSEIDKELAEYERRQNELFYKTKQEKLALSTNFEQEQLKSETELAEARRAMKEAEVQAKVDMQTLLTAIDNAENERLKEKHQINLDYEKAQASLEAQREAAYAQTVKEIVQSISPDLVAALTTSSNEHLLAEATKNMSPYAIANGTSVADTINTLVRGTSLEKIIDKVAD